jgi:hypothetical protein
MRVDWGKHEAKGLLCKLGSKYDDMTTYAEIGLFLSHETNAGTTKIREG